MWQRFLAVYVIPSAVKNLPFFRTTARFFAALRISVSLEESSRTGALGEMWFGAGRDSREFLTLDFGYGIGTGIVSNGSLLYGASESGGELGHAVVKPRGDWCHCGHRGCLETVASGEAIARRSGRATVLRRRGSGRGRRCPLSPHYRRGWPAAGHRRRQFDQLAQPRHGCSQWRALPRGRPFISLVSRSPSATRRSPFAGCREHHAFAPR